MTTFKSTGGRRRNTNGRMGRLIREEKAGDHRVRGSDERTRDDRQDGGTDRHVRG